MTFPPRLIAPVVTFTPSLAAPPPRSTTVLNTLPAPLTAPHAILIGNVPHTSARAGGGVGISRNPMIAKHSPQIASRRRARVQLKEHPGTSRSSRSHARTHRTPAQTSDSAGVLARSGQSKPGPLLATSHPSTSAERRQAAMTVAKVPSRRRATHLPGLHDRCGGGVRLDAIGERPEPSAVRPERIRRGRLAALKPL